MFSLVFESFHKWVFNVHRQKLSWLLIPWESHRQWGVTDDAAQHFWINSIELPPTTKHIQKFLRCSLMDPMRIWIPSYNEPSILSNIGQPLHALKWFQTLAKHTLNKSWIKWGWRKLCAWRHDDLSCWWIWVQQKRKGIGDRGVGQNQDQKETPHEKPFHSWRSFNS